MKTKQEIKDIIIKFFYLIDSDIKVEFFSNDDKNLNVYARIKSPQAFIGERGQSLVEIERLLKIIARKNSSEPLFINLDINDYKKRKGEQLEEIANKTADEVSLTGVGKKFPSLSAYERRIIHLTLAKREDIITESVDEGSQRRVVIKKKN